MRSRWTPTGPGAGMSGRCKGRRVVGSRNDDGTANLSGYDLPVDRVTAACDRFDRLAKAAKQDGHPDPIDHIRADLFLGMTDGTYAGLTDAQILARLLAEANLTQPHRRARTAEPADEPAGERAARPPTSARRRLVRVPSPRLTTCADDPRRGFVR